MTIGDPAEGRYVDVGDARLWVLESGEGYPILLLHGGPGLDHTQFRPWMDPLADRFRLVYVDQRSQGRSDLADERTWNLRRMAEQLLADQLPFHFAEPNSEAYRSFLEAAMNHMRFSPDVLRAFASNDYGAIEVEDRLGEIERPVLVIAAEFDRVTVPEAGWAIAEAVPRGECVLIKNAGHLSFAEKPRVVIEAIESFFDLFPP